MLLKGNKVLLRAAEERDRRQVYAWLAHSDLTPSMMGPPLFPDHPIPTWEAFCADYRPHYFDGSDPSRGRCFVIAVEDSDLGVVCYNTIDRSNGRTDVDIWLRADSDCGKGYGSDALRTLGDYLHAHFGITQLVVSPSARNLRAIAAYAKAGFTQIAPEKYQLYLKPEDMEYTDNVVLVKDYARNNALNRIPGTLAGPSSG
jgi:RimJ/RimL family protein N-acetyltransferase